MPPIVGLVGPRGAGKSTIARHLADRGWRRESFAAPLKTAVAAIFGWPPAALDGDDAAARRWRERPDPWWSRRLGQPVVPRRMLQLVGTELCRGHIHDELWIAAFERRLHGMADPVVVDDVRFVAEGVALRRLGARLLRVERPGGAETAAVEVDRHPSETEWRAIEVEATVINDGTRRELYAAVACWLDRAPHQKLRYSSR